MDADQASRVDEFGCHLSQSRLDAVQLVSGNQPIWPQLRCNPSTSGGNRWGFLIYFDHETEIRIPEGHFPGTRPDTLDPAPRVQPAFSSMLKMRRSTEEDHHSPAFRLKAFDYDRVSDSFCACDVFLLKEFAPEYCYDGPTRIFPASILPSGPPDRSFHLFQGAWTDPVTGIAYHRNRWYDPRTANWLSEDPLGAVDSANLYAFVGWGPHVGSDPLGLCRLTDWECRRYRGIDRDRRYLDPDWGVRSRKTWDTRRYVVTFEAKIRGRL